MVEVDLVFKIIIAGDSGVGKTATISRFIDGRFTHASKATIGVDFSLKYIDLNLEEHVSETAEKQIVLQLWDVAGESKFRSILPYYISGTDGFVLAFDGTKPTTLKHLYEWYEIIGLYLTNKRPLVLISTKNDLKQNINTNDVHQLMKMCGIKDYFPTSSLTGENIPEMFNFLTKLIATEHEHGQEQ